MKGREFVDVVGKVREKAKSRDRIAGKSHGFGLSGPKIFISPRGYECDYCTYSGGGRGVTVTSPVRVKKSRYLDVEYLPGNVSEFVLSA